MPKWKKDAKEFEVGVNYSDGRGYSSAIPKPIIDLLDNPKRIRFIVKENNVVELESSSS
jgi:hypothetical protein